MCEALPETAEQVIIFIKDTDGDIAHNYLMSRVGISYHIKMKNPPQQVDNYFERKGDNNVQ